MSQRYIEEKSDWVDKIPVVNGKTLNTVTDISPINTHIEMITSRINWLRNRLIYSTLVAYNSTAFLPYPIIDPIVFPGKDNKTVWIIGGRTTQKTPIPYVLVFDIVSETIHQTDIPAYPYTRPSYTITEDTVYCFGGYHLDPNTGKEVPVSDTMAYHIPLATWTHRSPLPIPLAGSVSVFTDRQEIIVGTGWTTSLSGSTVRTGQMFRYNYITDQMVPIRSYPYAIDGGAGAFINGMPTIFGGKTNTTLIDRIYQYDRFKNDWIRFVPNLLFQRAGLSVITIGNLLLSIYGELPGYGSTLDILDLSTSPYHWRNIRVQGMSRIMRYRFGTCVARHDSIVLVGGIIGNTPTTNILLLNY